jgi:hypothetical protein
MSRQDDLDAIQRLFPAERIGISKEEQRRSLEMRADGTLAAMRARLEAQKDAVKARNERIKANLKRAARKKLRESMRARRIGARQARAELQQWLTTAEGQEWLSSFQKHLQDEPGEA